MSKTNSLCWLSCVSPILGLLLCGATAEARRLSITRAAKTAWERHISSDSVYSEFRLQGRNGMMDAQVIPGRSGQRSRVVVESLTPGGRCRTTTFAVVNGGTPWTPKSDLRKLSSVLDRKPAVPRRRHNHSRFGGTRYFNPRLEAARGNPAGTVGHAGAVGRAGFFPDSIGVRAHAGGHHRRSGAFTRYWSTPSSGGRRSW